MDYGESSYRRFLDGDEKAFEEIVLTYRDGLTFFINRYVHELSIAEEIAIDVFADVAAHPSRYNFKTSVKTYLYMLGKSRSIDYLRRERRMMKVSLEEAKEWLADEVLLEDSVLADEKKKILHNAIKQLPRDMQTVVHLLYFEEFSYEEAARVMGKNRKQISNLTYRAKVMLRTILGKEGEECL